MALIARLIICAAFLLSGTAVANMPSLLNPSAKAQTTDKPPEPLKLNGKWWGYLAIEHKDLAPRIEATKSNIRQSTESRAGALENEIGPIVQQIHTSLDGLLNLQSTQEVEPEAIEEPQAQYSIEELEALFVDYHKKVSLQAQLSNSLRDGEKAAEKAERAAVEAFTQYRKAKDDTERKLILGLTVMANRLNWYLWEVQSTAGERQSENLSKQLEQILARTKTAAERLRVDKASLAELSAQIDKQDSELDKAKRQTAIIEDEYTGIVGLDFLSRMRARLAAQNVVVHKVLEAQVEVELAQLRTIKTLATLNKESFTQQDLDPIEQLGLNKTLLERIADSSKSWRDSIAAERNAIESLMTSGYDLEESKTAQTILNQRVDLIKETLNEVSQLEKETFALGSMTESLQTKLGSTEGWIFKLQNAGNLVYAQTGERIWKLLNYKLFEWGGSAVTSWDLVQAALVLLVAFFIARIVQRSLLKFNVADGGKIPPAIYALSRVLFYAIIVLGIFAAFSSIGVNFTNLAIVAGALSVGIGFGLQSIVNNFVSGIIILFEQNIKVGDFIELDTGLRGIVRDINVRSTIVNTLDNLDIIVPNSELVATKVTNYTLNEPMVRIHVPFGVAYGTDKELVKKAVLEAARNIDITYDDGANRRPQVWLTGFGDSSLDFELVTWVNPKLGKATPGSWKALYSWEIESALNRYDIVIPFPQRDLHLRSGYPPDKPNMDVPQVL